MSAAKLCILHALSRGRVMSKNLSRKDFGPHGFRWLTLTRIKVRAFRCMSPHPIYSMDPCCASFWQVNAKAAWC